MHNLVFFCKSYNGDFERVKILLLSFQKHNKENIQLYLSVPESDITLFKPLEQDNVHLISDESFAKQYFANSSNFTFSQGYVNQQICKLCFWETNIATNYFCIDSDSEFIRDFYYADFMAEEEIPYTVLVMDKDLAIEKHYKAYWDIRQKKIQEIFDAVGLMDKRLRTCHGFQILNTKVLSSLKHEFMLKNNYSYEDLLEISPFEFTWYNAWFQKSKIIPEYAIEPLFKTFHYRIEYIFSKLKLISKADIAGQYVGIILNSNWKKKKEISYSNPTILYKILYKIIKKI